MYRIEEKKNFTAEDFESNASSQEKRLWAFLKDYPETFNRSVLAGFEGFMFVCHAAGLVVELEKFRRFGDERSGSLGKKGEALRDLGLKRVAYTYREIDTDFEGVCAAIDRAVKRQISQKSLVAIKKPVKLSLDDEDEPVKKGYRITVSGEDIDEDKRYSYKRFNRRED
ncbi:MAG: DUF559 domain-containing protein [Eubacterium sp.]|nr:DUF559 domain-containing protein [Eubacterium sp.]